jgi:hypothetical protein
MNSKRLFPVYNGFEFWLTKLDNDTHPFGYQIQETALDPVEAGPRHWSFDHWTGDFHPER